MLVRPSSEKEREKNEINSSKNQTIIKIEKEFVFTCARKLLFDQRNIEWSSLSFLVHFAMINFVVPRKFHWFFVASLTNPIENKEMIVHSTKPNELNVRVF